MGLCFGAKTGRVAGKTGHRAPGVNVVAMGLRQIIIHIAPKGGRRFIGADLDALSQFGSTLRHCRSENLANQVGLRLKMVVEAALRKARMLHQLVEPDGVHSALPEKLRRRSHYGTAVFRSLLSRHAQSSLPEAVPILSLSLSYDDFENN